MMPPLDDDPALAIDFPRLMQALGPFESRPLIAVGVSGGRDSMALAWLAHQWAGRLGGVAVGLTVDHGLRPEAAAEAAQVGRWLAGWGMKHHILVNEKPIPQSDIQASARTIRYELLEQWCQRAGCLHLLLAHHQADQAETFMLRLGRGSGVKGLAAMAPITYRRGVRLLRPLLSEPRRRLQAVLSGLGQPWIDDPSNQQTAYMRVRMRYAFPSLADFGLTSARLAETAARLAGADRVCEQQTVALLAEAVYPDPGGWGWLDLAPFRTAEQDSALRALAGVLTAFGGQAYAPRADRLYRLHHQVYAIAHDPECDAGLALRKGLTVHGCRLRYIDRPANGGGGRVLITREVRHPEVIDLCVDGQEILWDGRFRVFLNVIDEKDFLTPWQIGPLGNFSPPLSDRNGTETQKAQKRAWNSIPGMARNSLPALYEGGALCAIPQVQWALNDRAARLLERLDLRFSPRRAMAFVGFLSCV